MASYYQRKLEYQLTLLKYDIFEPVGGNIGNNGVK
jgi:hypothetical protein